MFKLHKSNGIEREREREREHTHTCRHVHSHTHKGLRECETERKFEMEIK